MILKGNFKVIVDTNRVYFMLHNLSHHINVAFILINIINTNKNLEYLFKWFFSSFKTTFLLKFVLKY